jgi:hypothetical protein
MTQKSVRNNFCLNASIQQGIPALLTKANKDSHLEGPTFVKIVGFFINKKSAVTLSHLSSRIQRIAPEIRCTPLHLLSVNQDWGDFVVSAFLR